MRIIAQLILTEFDEMNLDIETKGKHIPEPVVHESLTDQPKHTKKKIWPAVTFAALISMVLLAIFAWWHTPSLTASQKEFIRQYPGYGLGNRLSGLRRSQFSSLQKNEVYLDYTGAGTFQDKQLKRTMKIIRKSLYCNTHSLSSCSKRTEEAIEEVREQLLDYFSAPKGTYSVIFT